MTCDGCVKDVSNALYKLDGMRHHRRRWVATPRNDHLTAIPLNIGIKDVDVSLKDQLIFIQGTAPPSSIVTAIQGTGRDAILRGSGTTNSNLNPVPLCFLRTTKSN
jgi:Copper chaperone